MQIHQFETCALGIRIALEKGLVFSYSLANNLSLVELSKEIKDYGKKPGGS